jgi:hypothetical protein
VKPNINSVEVHPHPSTNRHLVDGGAAGGVLVNCGWKEGVCFPMGADCSGEFWVTIKAHPVVGG